MLAALPYCPLKVERVENCLSPSRMRKRPDSSGGIRRTFRGERGSESDGTSPGASGGVRTASLPVGSALVKEAGDKRPVSAHSILNSITRHSSLKTKVRRDLRPLSWPLCSVLVGKVTNSQSAKCVCVFLKVESPQMRKSTQAGRSKSFSNHRPLEPEFIAQVDHGSQVWIEPNARVALP